MADDLNTPLGTLPPGIHSARYPVALVPIVGLVAVGVVFGVWATVVDDPLGGEPNVIVHIEPDNQHTTRSDVAIVGVKSGNLGEDAPAIGDRPQAAPMPQTERSAASATPQKRSGMVKLDALLEDTRMGRLPRVGADGTRPLDAYAQPLGRATGAAPKIAIVVTGLGLSQTATQAALDKLPPEVSLAFAPTGASLERWSVRARAEGHETLMQIPLEPYDFPDNDPGPQTIIAGQDAKQNLDRLQFSLARITGYVGVMNYMGARATSDLATMRPVLSEIAKRGLMYLDDGTSSRSIVKDIAATARLPFDSAELVLDAVPSPAEIDARLSRLETMARTTGMAVGVASTLPISVQRLSDWAKSLEARGLVLVPISYAVSKPAASLSPQSREIAPEKAATAEGMSPPPSAKEAEVPPLKAAE